MIRLIAALTLVAGTATAQDWRSFHGDLAAQKFSPITSIDPQNVHRLEQVWSVETGDVSDGSGDLPATVWSATPIYANGMLYLGTPFYRILALDPATGNEIWSYDTNSRLEALSQPALKSRGVAYWEAAEPDEGPCQRRVYLGTMEATIHAVDAENGQPCSDFADGGVLNVNQWNTMKDKFPLSVLQPPTVYRDTLFIGWAGEDWQYTVAPPGSVFAVDARSGDLKWELELLPDDIRAETGTANVWTAMTVDAERGILYLPVSSPSPNYWGGNRTEEIPLATSVTAVDAETGEVLWSFQHVHHDIWDYDTVAAPQLVDIEKDGQIVPALVQVSKQGMLFILNRLTGEPIFEIAERPVPQTEIAGEVTTDTQPFTAVVPHLMDLENLPEVSRIGNVTWPRSSTPPRPPRR